MNAAHHDPSHDPDDITPADIDQWLTRLPFDWRWLLGGWALGFVAGVLIVLWFLVFVAGPLV